jgi:GNAT superfamily N-acetyltransferase
MLKFQISLKTPLNSVGGFIGTPKGIGHQRSSKISSLIRSKKISLDMASTIDIKQVNPENNIQIEEFRSMTRKYLEFLGIDLGFQGVENELASLPGNYHPDAGGCMLLAYISTMRSMSSITSQCIGAVALRPLSGQHLRHLTALEGIDPKEICEMKRLFVIREYQNKGVGTQLTFGITQAAKKLGYKAIVLDTLERLSGANAVYKNQGFKLCERYNDCPLPGVLYFMKKFEDDDE